MQLLRRLRFDDQLVIDDHVDPLCTKKVRLVHDRKPDFARHLVSAQFQLDLQRLRVEMLVVAVTKVL